MRPAAGSIGGKVVDKDGQTILGARVVLNGGRETVTDDAGRYLFLSVGAGDFKVSVTMAGFSAGEGTGRVRGDEPVEVAPMVLRVTDSAEVVVTTSREDLAAAEVKVEETQRLFGFAPNFYVTYDWHAAPLSAKQKFGLAYRNATDPANVLIDEASALIQQANNNLPGYGQGAAGFARRFGANTADLTIGTFLGGAIFPALFRQDPRFFYMGPTRTKKRRFFYALSTAAIARGDNGKWQPNYSSILGDVATGSLSNLYYPASNRHGWHLTIENGLLGAALDGVGNVIQEFAFKKITPHAPNYPTKP